MGVNDYNPVTPTISFCCSLKNMKIKESESARRRKNPFLIIFHCSLHLGIQSGPCEDQLIKLDEQCSEKTYKVTFIIQCL